MCDREHAGIDRGHRARADARSPRGRARIRDVARLAGVSHQTVSACSTIHPSIRPETKQRVLDVMAELQYKPNRAARALVTSRSRTIGILSASSTHYGPASSIAAIESAARSVRLLGEHREHRVE